MLPESFKLDESYQEQMRHHLSAYKVDCLKVSGKGIWRKNGKERAHILPFENLRLNILEPFREQFWRYFATSGIKLHSDFHHLTSSQAMCFNLFYPCMSSGNLHLQLLGDIFGSDAPLSDRRFEFIYDAAEGTNFDFQLKAAEARLLFELRGFLLIGKG